MVVVFPHDETKPANNINGAKCGKTCMNAGRWRKRQRHPPLTALTKQTMVLKRNHLLPVGNPCPRDCSTKPSSPHSSLPSNSQSRHCNRKAETSSHNHLLLVGTPFHGPGSTRLFCPLTSQRPNWRIHQRNCKDLQASLAALAEGEELATLAQ